MKYILSLILFATIASACIAQSIDQVEAVEYDAANNRWLASNGNSILSMTTGGPVEYFGKSAQANYGMEILNGNLCAIYSNSLEIYDLQTGDLLADLAVPGASFLNGMATDGDSKVWMSDFGNGEIYEVDVSDPADPTAELLNLQGNLGTPNGLWYAQEEEILYAVQWGSNASVLAIDPQELTIEVAHTTTLGNIDGIVRDDQGNFYISSWSPSRITRFSEDFTSEETITVPGISNPADIDLAWEIDTLAIPNTGTNEILFVGVNPPVSVIEKSNELSLGVYPNPVTTSSVVEFNLSEAREIELTITDVNGRVVEKLLSGVQVAGNHKVVLANLKLRSGQYFLKLSGESGRLSQARFILQ